MNNVANRQENIEQHIFRSLPAARTRQDAVVFDSQYEQADASDTVESAVWPWAGVRSRPGLVLAPPVNKGSPKKENRKIPH